MHSNALVDTWFFQSIFKHSYDLYLKKKNRNMIWNVFVHYRILFLGLVPNSLIFKYRALKQTNFFIVSFPRQFVLWIKYWNHIIIYYFRKCLMFLDLDSAQLYKPAKFFLYHIYFLNFIRKRNWCDSVIIFFKTYLQQVRDTIKYSFISSMQHFL